ncbi:MULTISPECIES: DUF4235 domain-containing protein [Micrococcaceae]|uniref:DUF4235 domain-containing protein n=2 Tax=Micrococcaceae TaxID=1268 RepID=A0A5B7WXC9_9MICC|nr:MULTISPECIES: DUF4235 domain-containing protein [Micrococcaceae]QCY47985.1 hypothetical protein GcLGCM259_2276 [Glutamicibacter creatinolyticus]
MKPMMKLLATGISLGAGFVGSKLVDRLWKGFTGNDAPRHGQEAEAEASMRQALAFAVFSSVVAAIIQVLTDRGTRKALAKLNK